MTGMTLRWHTSPKGKQDTATARRSASMATRLRSIVKGQRDKSNDWDPLLGLAILRARTHELSRLGYDVRGLEIIAAFQGLSRSRAQQQVETILRKLRVRLC